MSRLEKLSKAIKKEISQIIHEELKDPRLGFITVTEVKLSPDLRVAKIYYSVLGDEKSHLSAKEGLNSAKGYIRKLLGSSIKLRFIPEIVFIFDSSIEESVRISAELDRVKTPRDKSRGFFSL